MSRAPFPGELIDSVFDAVESYPRVPSPLKKIVLELITSELPGAEGAVVRGFIPVDCLPVVVGEPSFAEAVFQLESFLSGAVATCLQDCGVSLLVSPLKTGVRVDIIAPLGD